MKSKRKIPMTYTISPAVLARLDKYADKANIPRVQVVEAGIVRELDHREGKNNG